MTATLWGPRSRVVLGAGWSIGLLVVFLGWWKASGEATTDDQFRWLAVGVAGMLLCLAVSAGWLFTGMRAVGTRIRVAVPAPFEVPEPVVELRAVPAAADDDEFVAAPGMRYYHRRSCRLAQGKAIRPSARASHRREGRAACGVCRPDQPVEVSAA